MRRIAMLALVSFSFALLPGRARAEVAGEPDRAEVEAAHYDLRSKAMWTLLSWSAANMVGGGIAAGVASDKEFRIFMGANAAWNIVNALIAGLSLYGQSQRTPGEASAVELVRDAESFEKALLINAGLDVGYIATGIAVWLWGSDISDPWRSGIGQALVVQGGFLLGFDLILSLLVGGQLDDLWLLITPAREGGDGKVLSMATLGFRF